MKKEHIINWQGTDLVKYEGLLDEAHQQGLKRISATLIQIPHQDNGHMAVAQAEAETEKGTFSGIGDASPQSVSRATAMHLLKIVYSSEGTCSRRFGEHRSSCSCRGRPAG